LCSDVDFSPPGRAENIRRAAEVAGLAAESGIITVAAFVSPYRADRALARTVAEPARFIEVFVNASVAVCEKRDVKGHYAAARAGRIIQFTGISAPYEPPAHPEIELKTDLLSVPECVGRIMGYLFPVTL
jgi:adenylylsulfate kinase